MCGGPATIDQCKGCLNTKSCNYNPGKTIADNKQCKYVDCAGSCGGSATRDACGICNGNGKSCVGCMDPDACNFRPSATADNIPSSCTYPEQNFHCNGACAVELDCEGVCAGSAKEDRCGVCEGDGTTCMGCTDAAACTFDKKAVEDTNPSSCVYPMSPIVDCAGNCIADVDCRGVCGGKTKIDPCEICGGDGSSCKGCKQTDACNYDQSAELNGDCTYPVDELHDCGGMCYHKTDCMGVCNGTTVLDYCGICGGDGSCCRGPEVPDQQYRRVLLATVPSFQVIGSSSMPSPIKDHSVPSFFVPVYNHSGPSPHSPSPRFIVATAARSCNGRCNDLSEDGSCSCSPNCCEQGNCCIDYPEMCPLLKQCTNSGYSCAGRCGRSSRNGECFCDDSCCQYADCCEDRIDQCIEQSACSDSEDPATGFQTSPTAINNTLEIPAPQGSRKDAPAPNLSIVEGKCVNDGEDYCGGTPNGVCYCDNQCSDLADCCSDFVSSCPDRFPAPAVVPAPGEGNKQDQKNRTGPLINPPSPSTSAITPSSHTHALDIPSPNGHPSPNTMDSHGDLEIPAPNSQPKVPCLDLVEGDGITECQNETTVGPTTTEMFPSPASDLKAPSHNVSAVPAFFPAPRGGNLDASPSMSRGNGSYPSPGPHPAMNPTPDHSTGHYAYPTPRAGKAPSGEVTLPPYIPSPSRSWAPAPCFDDVCPGSTSTPYRGPSCEGYCGEVKGPDVLGYESCACDSDCHYFDDCCEDIHICSFMSGCWTEPDRSIKYLLLFSYLYIYVLI